MIDPIHKPVVLFVCVHNSGRSLAAKVLLDHYAQGRVDVRSAGSDPGSGLNPSVVAVLRERNLDPSREFPKPLTDLAARDADVVVTMGCGDTCPYYLGKRYVDWDLQDPAGLPVEAVRPIVDAIDRRVRVLLAELTSPHSHAEVGAEAIAVRPMYPEDWPAVAAIYATGIATGNATFETAPPAWETWDAGHRDDLRFVAVGDDRVVGWVGAGNFSDRACYAGVVEHSVYVDPDWQGRGVGRLLLAHLVDTATAAGVWTVQTGIFPENTASVALHQAGGFRVVGRRERLGQLGGVWRDVLLMERRNPDTI